MSSPYTRLDDEEMKTSTVYPAAITESPDMVELLDKVALAPRYVLSVCESRALSVRLALVC